MKFWCMKQSLNCPVNLIGKPDCTNCEKYAKCEYCAKHNTPACKQCEVKDNDGNC